MKNTKQIYVMSMIVGFGVLIMGISGILLKNQVWLYSAIIIAFLKIVTDSGFLKKYGELADER